MSETETEVPDEPARPRVSPGAAAAQPYALRPTPEGFRLARSDGYVIEAASVANGWLVRSGDGLLDSVLRELHGDGGGFVLEDRASSTARGRTSRLATAASDRAAVSIVLDDGRVFSIVPGRAGEPGYDLAGWAGPGAYWRATRSADGWELSPTIAGLLLEGAGVLVVLFAAEVLAAERT